MKQTVIIHSEIPVKKNSYRIGKNGLYKPTKITDFEKLVSQELLVQGIKKIDDDTVIGMSAEIQTTSNKKDLDGMITTLLDALQDGGMFENDNMIFSMVARKVILKKESEIKAYITLTY